MKILIQVSLTRGAIEINDLKNNHSQRHYIKNEVPVKCAKSSGLYSKHVTIVIYDRNDSGQYCKTTIMIVIDDPSLS